MVRDIPSQYTAISRKVVGKSARDNPERYCGWFWVHCSSKKFERMAREAMDICLRVLKESNKGRFDSYSVRNSVLLISHITFRDCRVHIFSDNLSRNSCIYVVARSLLSNCGVSIYKRISRDWEKQNSTTRGKCLGFCSSTILKWRSASEAWSW